MLPNPPPPLTVTAFNRHVQALLVPQPTVRVVGEVSQPSMRSGNLYFELKDSVAKVRVNLWRADRVLRFEIKHGMQVICTGRPDLWVEGGLFSLNCSAIEPAGEGARWAALQRLKEALTAEGLFDTARKKPLPFLPKTVALITSAQGAVVRDMLRIIRDRAQVRIVVVDVRVQGEGAAELIARAIEYIDRIALADVILCGRGGGSAEDLWAFNEERLVRAFAACKTPIISAVGHETDTVLTDHAADWRAPTPTAAAERAVPRFADLQAALASLTSRAVVGQRRQLQGEQRHVAQLRARLGDGRELTGRRRQGLDERQQQAARATERTLERQRRRIDGLRQRLQAAHPQKKLAERRKALVLLAFRLHAAGRRTLEQRRQRLQNKAAVLVALSPRAALGRGYGIVRRPGGQALASVAGLQVAEPLEILLRDGVVQAEITALRIET